MRGRGLQWLLTAFSRRDWLFIVLVISDIIQRYASVGKSETFNEMGRGFRKERGRDHRTTERRAVEGRGFETWLGSDLGPANA